MTTQIPAPFEVFAHAMPNHVWTARADGYLDWFNERVYHYSGACVGELDGQGWIRLVHPEDLPTSSQLWAEALSTGQHYETEFRLRRADGCFRWHLTRATPIRTSAGSLERWIGTNTDIEEHKAASAALAHLNETLELRVAERTADRDRMWRLSTDVMLVADFTTVVTAVNPAWSALLGWQEDDLIGRPFIDLVHPDDHARILVEVGRLSRGLTPLNFMTRMRDKGGGYRSLDWTAVPDERYMHAVGRDVTAAIEAAEALALSEQALRQSQKMDAVGQLTGGIAHDFNNMLSVVIGTLDLLKRRPGVDEKGLRYIDVAKEAAQHASVLTRQLLAFARQQPLQPKPLDANRLVSGMSDMLRYSLGADVRLEAVLAADLWRVNADPNQLESVILNLAVNARDAMPGGGRLIIETQNTQLDARYASGHAGVQPGQYVLIAVTDTGSGMAADVIAKAFDPFFTTKPPGKGTGLGLSQVYGFIKQSGGHVKIYSEPGRGTTLKVYLPRLAGEPDDCETSSPDLELARGHGREVMSSP